MASGLSEGAGLDGGGGGVYVSRDQWSGQIKEVADDRCEVGSSRYILMAARGAWIAVLRLVTMLAWRPRASRAPASGAGAEKTPVKVLAKARIGRTEKCMVGLGTRNRRVL